MLEDLPNELILLIFSYIELTELHRSFSSLNSRFEHLLYNNFTPLYARLTSEFTLPLERFFFRINNLYLINWNPNDILLLINELNLPKLNCLTIESSDNIYFGQPTNDLIHRIISLSNLSKCQINLAPTIYICDFQLPFSNSIKNLNLSMITLDMLFSVLIHVPNLCLLNVWLNSNGRRFDSRTYDRHYCCLNLKKCSIGLHNDITFEEILFLLPRMPVLHSFEMFGSVWDRQFLNQNHWENILLGENLFPLLNKIKINISIRYTNNVPHIGSLASQFNKDIFHRTNFSVIYDRMFWFHVKCSWNT
jgi:hypothetical protein